MMITLMKWMATCQERKSRREIRGQTETEDLQDGKTERSYINFEPMAYPGYLALLWHQGAIYTYDAHLVVGYAQPSRH